MGGTRLGAGGPLDWMGGTRIGAGSCGFAGLDLLFHVRQDLASMGWL